MILFPSNFSTRKRKIGRPLSAHEKWLYQPYFAKEVLDCARVIEGRVPFWLRKVMHAVVLGNCIYFRPGVYQSGTLCSIDLLAHELTHVEQFGNGMTVIKYLWASRRGYIKNRYEIEACAKAAMIRSTLLL